MTEAAPGYDWSEDKLGKSVITLSEYDEWIVDGYCMGELDYSAEYFDRTAEALMALMRTSDILWNGEVVGAAYRLKALAHHIEAGKTHTDERDVWASRLFEDASRYADLSEEDKELVDRAIETSRLKETERIREDFWARKLFPSSTGYSDLDDEQTTFVDMSLRLDELYDRVRNWVAPVQVEICDGC